MGLQSDDEIERRADELLAESIGPDADFRQGQWDAIAGLVSDTSRLLLVQRTGWGKSTVYFIATKLRREQGYGPTLVISPLLALMRNQIQDAEKQLGLNAWTINSNNKDEWTDAKNAILENSCDLLLISPERLANASFHEEILLEMEDEFGLLVVDEAHCISDWGHDFRPDYRRIKRILQQLPDHIPVAATTATANDRVIADITSQIPDLQTIRGDLVRDSLRIQTNPIGSRARRLAWIAENVPSLPGSGIVYCLTTDETEIVATWLNSRGLEFEAYHGGMDGDHRRELEEQLMDNELDGLVATNALGMGFNKPDLGWVIHFQRPPNLIRYYQEIGRAGRALDEAFAVLLSGEEDDRIAEFFIEEAFPKPEAFDVILETLEASPEPLYKYELLKQANISWKAASQCLDMLRVDNAVIRVETGFERTAVDWSYDHERIELITQQRRDELERIKEFVRTVDCLTRFIDEELDGSLESACGRCANCAPSPLPSSVADEQLVEAAIEHYKANSWSEISPRYYMPDETGRSKIEEELKPEPGRALSVYGDPGYGRLVEQGYEKAGRYDDALLEGAAHHIENEWNPQPPPTWVTSIPSGSDGDAVRDLATRIGDRLGIDYLPTISQVREMQSQHELANSYQKRWNVEGAYEVTGSVRSDPVLLIDETVGSRWAITETAMLLREAGSGPVFPFALAERNNW